MNDYVPSECSPLHGEKDLSRIQAALDAGVNPNNTCLSGMTPLHWSRNSQTTQALLKAGANPNSWDINHRTPLHFAPDAQSVSLLLHHGANPNARDFKGRTPLHTAKNSEIAKTLIAHGAKVNLVDSYNQTPLDLQLKRSTSPSFDHGIITVLQNASSVSHTVTSSSMDFLPSKQTVHSLLVDLLSPMFLVCLGLSIFLFFVQKGIYRFGKKYNGKTALVLLSAPLVLLNPFALACAFAVSSAAPFLYFFQWTPKELLSCPNLQIVFVLCVWHLGEFLYFSKKYHEGFLLYALKQLPYLMTLPFWVLMGIAATENPGEATGNLVTFFGFPYFIATSLLGFYLSRKILRPSFNRYKKSHPEECP